MTSEKFDQDSLFEPISGDGSISPGTQVTESTPSLPAGRVARSKLTTAGWALLGVLSFLFFTLLKVPTERIEGNITQQIVEAAQNAGYQLTPAQARVKIGFGITYEMEEVSIRSTQSDPATPPIRFRQIRISPSLLSYALGQIAGKFEVAQKEEKQLQGVFSIPDSSRGKTGTLKFSAEWRDFEPALWFPTSPLSPLSKLNTKLEGQVEFAGELQNTETWSGVFNIKSPQVALGESSIMGMSIPGLKTSALSIRAQIDAGSKKLKFEELNLGKLGGNEDIAATLTGDIGLQSDWRNWSFNLSAKYRIQGELQKRLGAMLMLLDKFKKEDGSYSTSIKGSPLAPQFQ